MPLDAASLYSPRPRPPQTPCLNEAERQAAALFGPRLLAVLADLPPISLPVVVLARLSAGIAEADFRLAPEGSVEAIPRPGEVAVACLPTGVPEPAVDRRALAIRLASAAAGAWRQQCQLRRLGLLAGQGLSG
jgi:hypothetical protein